MTKTLTTGGCHSANDSGTHLMMLTHAHWNAEQMVKLYLQRCGQLERQAHYAVWDILYHRLTFIMLNLPQRPHRANLCRNCKAALRPLPSLQHCNSHISQWGLMGMERCVTLLPCIQETWSYKVQEERCLLSNDLTTCHCDSPPLRSGCWSLCWGPWWEGIEMFMQTESSVVARKSN